MKDKIIKILIDMDVKPSYAPTIAQGDTTPMVTRLNHIGEFRKAIATRIEEEMGNEWVDVNDRLPEELKDPGKSVAVLVTEGPGCVVWEALYEDNGDFCSSLYNHYLDVAYWREMPLPPNPKSKK